ncbi:MAG: hypothetical protein AB8F95_18055 [Bacteroidia bacterium]
MAIPRAFLLFNTLSSEESKRFRDFVQSPYHNRSQKLIRLFELLEPHFPLKKQDDELEEEVSESLIELLAESDLFPQDTVAESALSNLLSRFRALIETFFIHEQISQNAHQAHFTALQDLGKRVGAEDFFTRNADKFEKTLTKENALSIAGSWHLFRLAEMKLSFSTMHADRADSYPLEDARKLLQTYVLINHMRYELSALNRRQLTGEEYTFRMQEPFLTYLSEEKSLLAHPLLSLYYHMVRCFDQPDNEAFFQELQVAWKAHISKIAETESSELFAAYVNLYIARKRRGKQSLEDIFHLYRDAASGGGLVSSEGIQVGNYLNVVDVSLALCRAADSSDFEEEILKWLRTFLNEKRPEIRGAVRDSAWQLAQALIAYHQYDFKQAAQLLQLQSGDLMLELKRRVLLVKVYTTLEEWDLCESVRSSGYIFLHRKKERFSEEKFEVWNTFFLLTKSLIQLLSQDWNDKEAWEKFAQKLQQSPHLESRAWLERFYTSSFNN